LFIPNDRKHLSYIRLTLARHCSSSFYSTHLDKTQWHRDTLTHTDTPICMFEYFISRSCRFMSFLISHGFNAHTRTNARPRTSTTQINTHVAHLTQESAVSVEVCLRPVQCRVVRPLQPAVWAAKVNTGVEYCNQTCQPTNTHSTHPPQSLTLSPSLFSSLHTPFHSSFLSSSTF
jgi:hypothetical protein